MKSCIILCGGDAVSSEVYNVTAPKEAYIIAADSGLLLANDLGVCPQLIIGDFDSMKKPESDKIRVFPIEKDDTDLMLAVKEGLEQGCKDFYIYGATGGRLDHTFAAIQGLAFLLDNGAHGQIIADDTRIELLLPARYELPSMHDFTLSLFDWSDTVSCLDIQGTKYSAKGITLKSSFPLGVSNKVMEDSAIISFSEGILLVIRSRL